MAESMHKRAQTRTDVATSHTAEGKLRSAIETIYVWMISMENFNRAKAKCRECHQRQR